jgi:hypothetical protein
MVILGSIALAYLAGSGVVTNTSVVARGMFRAVRHAVDGDYRQASVEAVAALTAPAVMSYISTSALVMDVVDAAFHLAEPAVQEEEVPQMPRRYVA